MKFLHVLVPQPADFYSLYTYGTRFVKTDKNTGSDFTYPEDSLIFLFYTYPSHRRAYAVRFPSAGAGQGTLLPALSAPVHILIRAHASKVDKLKKSVSYLSEHYKSPFLFSDGFYIRLHFILQQAGKINYESIRNTIELMGESAWNNNSCTAYRQNSIKYLISFR